MVHIIEETSKIINFSVKVLLNNRLVTHIKVNGTIMCPMEMVVRLLRMATFIWVVLLMVLKREKMENMFGKIILNFYNIRVNFKMIICKEMVFFVK